MRLLRPKFGPVTTNMTRRSSYQREQVILVSACFEFGMTRVLVVQKNKGTCLNLHFSNTVLVGAMLYQPHAGLDNRGIERLR